MKTTFYLDELKEFFYNGLDAKVIFDMGICYLVRADAYKDKETIVYLHKDDYFECEEDDGLYIDWLNNILDNFGFGFNFL